MKLRQELEAQKERWGGMAASRKNQVIEEEDEFDAMFEEATGIQSKNAPKQIGTKDNIEEEVKEEEPSEEIPGGKTLEEVSEEVPQDIKDMIIDLEAEQQEKLRATMLRNTFQPKTSALKNLQDMFEEYPVVTNESLRLKMDTLGQCNIESEEIVNGLDAK